MLRVGALLSLAGLCGCGSSTFSTGPADASTPDAGNPDAQSDGITAIRPDAGTVGEAGQGDAGDGGVVEAGEGGCPSSTPLDCNGKCVDNTTITNCGTCGTVCSGPEAGPGNPACLPSGCAVVCDNDGGDAAATEILCSGSCVPPDTIENCGGCNNACNGPTSGNGTPACVGEHCNVNCSTGYHPAGTNCASDCLANTDDPSADPCAVADGLGVFVSGASGNDSTGDGSKEHPFATITKALTAGLGLRIYACGTLATEPQPLSIGSAADGAVIFGGFDCSTWAYSTSTKAKIAPSTPGLVVVIDGLTTGITFQDFELDAVAATGAGGTSQTVVVNGSQGVVFRRTDIAAGAAGTKGASGSPGSNTWSGTATSGNNASSTSPSLGGLEQSNCTCGGKGGYGGNAGTWNSSTFTVLSTGANGEAGTIGSATNAGGGAHQAASGPPDVVPCSVGTAGNGGGSGTPGTGGSNPGLLALAGWSNPTGTGTAGQVGGAAQGGGGGGGGLYDPSANPNGLGGSAGGGCGGCGGAGGATGGGPGGSSIPLIVISSAVTLDTCALTASNASAGGTGGGAQAGQSGGPPGSPATSGCNGGGGGTGGTGGAAGGGAGGHSIGIAYHGTAPTQTGTVTIDIGTAGTGGSPGSGISTGSSTGADGIAAQTQAF